MTAQEPAAAAAGTIQIGRDLEVNRLGYGAMRLTGPGTWGPPADPAAARAVLRRAVELGVTLVDTSDSYGPAYNEDLIADALHPYPEGLVIATKGGLTRQGPGLMTPDGRPEYLKAACEASLQRLKLERIDLYQLHAVDRTVPYAESVGALADLRREGKIRHIGVSNVTAGDLEQALEITPIASVQNRYNVTDRRFQDVLGLCASPRARVHGVGPLDAGAASGRAGVIGRIATAHGATPAQVALAWLLHASPALLPIPGTASIEHLESNAAAAQLALGDREMADLAAVKPSLKTVRRRLRAGVGRAARRLGLRR